MSSKKLQSVVDQLGQVKAQLAELEAIEAGLRKQLVEAGVEAVEGRLFRATVSTFEATNVNWKGLVEQLAPPERLVKKFTSTAQRTTVKVVARNGNGV